MFLNTRILHLPRRAKRLMMVAADFLMIPLALWSAFALRMGDSAFNPMPFVWLFALAAIISVPTFARLGLYRAVVRYMGPQAAFAVLKGVTITTISLMILVLMVRVGETPRSVFVIFWLIAVLYVGGSRFFLRAYFQWLTKSYTEREMVAIYGAGSAGVQLATALNSGHYFMPVAFIDDNKALHGSVINGIQVYHPDTLDSVISNLKVTQVLLAVPSISHIQRQKILNRLEEFPVYVRTVPSMPELVSGEVHLDDIQDIDIEDLLGRDAVPPQQRLLSTCVTGKTVMVTGAAGSIGSELCRQIIQIAPRRVLLFEVSEYGLYQIENELRSEIAQHQFDIELIPLLGSVTDSSLVKEVLLRFRVDVVFHAAAYKHVPIVEHNIVAGVSNNVFGTLAMAESAAQAKVGTFVLISTDKAVRPTNVMGATKRLAELILQALAASESQTRFCMVRFGNVLGSSGSVVPLFRKQIRAGGPVTVTHPEVSRYFMTLNEAAQLVIQAGAIVRGGDVLVLDMGEQVKIADLARKMVHLMGMSIRDEADPNGDIAIEYRGLRPGEKLKEELLLGDRLTGTEHSKILRAQEDHISWDSLSAVLDELRDACLTFEHDRICKVLLDQVAGFEPMESMVDHLWARASGADEASISPAKVTRLYPNN